ncbi:hypothetical protein HELRODRAFT_78788, partial [Helobdella robusta]|uniref:Uncharacterized protein n=1 Tax=Helobdella robusta TaxID=6412 RepID=T1G3F8_HELRO
FQCVTDRTCVNKTRKCDGIPDCSDRSDESGCSHNFSHKDGCNPGQFRCVSSGHCISESNKCDSQMDCEDGSDEDEILCS